MQPQSGGAGSRPPSNKTPLIIGLLLTLFIIALVFGFWAFSGRQDFKNKSDTKVATAVAATKKAEDAKLNQQVAEQLKKPYKTYTGSSTFGSVSFSYPLTYSAYVDTSNTSQPIEGYFQPDVVPGIQSTTAFALRVELTSTAYNQLLSQFSSNIQQGTTTTTAYVPPKMAGVKNVQPGTLLTGAVVQGQQDTAQKGAMVIIPVRDKTLQIYTESTDYLSDFNNIILPSLTFVP